VNNPAARLTLPGGSDRIYAFEVGVLAFPDEMTIAGFIA
tara:strand:+ start:1039 stop:1155 length:117 start_codon:yes stop_codon:yes gene_type:complete